MGKDMEIAILVAALALSLLGCEERGEEPSDANQTTAGQIRQKADEALQAAADLAVQQKGKLLEASREQLNKLEQQFNQWADEAGIDDEQARQKLEQLSGQFKRALVEARGALEKAREVGAEAWQEAKPGLETAVTAVQTAYDEFVAYRKDQAGHEEQKEADPRIEP
ncbi:MAG: hypothetical protein ACYTAS_03415 [Planctomycetota bacterium]|jgi:CHASE3 domain sensor protein